MSRAFHVDMEALVSKYFRVFAIFLLASSQAAATLVSGLLKYIHISIQGNALPQSECNT